MRYALLAATLVPCGVLGYTLGAPWGLIPIAWGFLIAISMSRRWAWIEDDRELAVVGMLDVQAHAFVAFGLGSRRTQQQLSAHAEVPEDGITVVEG